MEQVLIGKNVAYAAKTGGGTAVTPNELAPGAVGVFTDNGVLLTSAALGPYADLKTFIIYAGTPTSLDHTPTIQRKGVVDYHSSAYAAPVKQVSTVTLTNAVFLQPNGTTSATPTFYNVNNGDEVIVRVIDNTIGQIRPNIQSYTMNVKLGDTTTTLATRLAASINADPDTVVTATSNAAVITLTGKGFGAYSLALDGIANNGGTQATTTAAYSGSGTPDELLSFERLSQASTHAVFEQAGGRGAVPVTLYTDPNATYDQLFLAPVNRHYSKDGMDATFGRALPIRLAFPVGSAAKVEVENILGALINYDQLTAPETGDDTP